MSEPASNEDYRHALRRLLAGWNLLMKLAINVPSEQRRTAMLVMGWVAQVHRFGRAFLQLEKVGLEHEAHPLVRSALEHTVMAHFVALTGDDAVTTRYALDQGQVAKFVARSQGSPHDVVPTPWVSENVSQVVDGSPPAPVDELKFMNNFADICERLGLSSSLYTAFQIECMLTHPTTSSSGMFLGPDGQHVQPDPMKGVSSGLVSMMASTVYWARRVLSDLMIDHPYEDWLNEIAEAIQVVPRLPTMQF